MTAGNRVLLIGFDPHKVPELDDAMVRLVDTAMVMGEQELRDHGFVTTYCLVAPDDRAVPTITRALTSDEFDCVVIGGGIRKPEAHLELFERVVNLSVLHAPHAAIAFNSTGADSAAAVLRWLPDHAPSR